MRCTSHRLVGCCAQEEEITRQLFVTRRTTGCLVRKKKRGERGGEAGREVSGQRRAGRPTTPLSRLLLEPVLLLLPLCRNDTESCCEEINLPFLAPSRRGLNKVGGHGVVSCVSLSSSFPARVPPPLPFSCGLHVLSRIVLPRLPYALPAHLLRPSHRRCAVPTIT